MRKETLTKEILTKEKCKIDMMKPPEPVFAWVMLSVLFLMLAGTLVLMAVYATDTETYILIAALSVLSLAAFMVIPIMELLRRRKNRRVREGKFHIEQDVLVKAAQDVYYRFPSRYDTGLRDMLDFSGHGCYFIERRYGRNMLASNRGRTYYKWSNLYKMSSEGVFNTAIEGDTFYLVIYDDDREKNPVMVYNAKFFDYKEESWENE